MAEEKEERLHYWVFPGGVGAVRESSMRCGGDFKIKTLVLIFHLKMSENGEFTNEFPSVGCEGTRWRHVHQKKGPHPAPYALETLKGILCFWFLNREDRGKWRCHADPPLWIEVQKMARRAGRM